MLKKPAAPPHPLRRLPQPRLWRDDCPAAAAERQVSGTAAVRRRGGGGKTATARWRRG